MIRAPPIKACTMKAQFIALAVLAAGYSQAFAALVVDLDLGLLDVGETSIAGQVTAGPAGNAIAYSSPFQNYSGGEVVFEFAIEQALEVSLTSSAFGDGGDPDAFLLNSLDVVEGQASGFIATAYLDGALGSTQGFGLLDPGTYYLSVEDWAGGAPTFEYTLGINEFVVNTPTAADLGVIGDDASVIALDTFGSEVGDTELGIYDAVGTLIGLNDDAGGGTFQSAIAFGALPEGTYYVAAGAYNSVFGSNFEVVGGTSEGGGIFLNTGEGGPQGAAEIAPGEVAWFSFGIVPEPSSMSLIALAGLTLLGRRRR